MASDYTSLQRSLALLRRLQWGATTRDELLDYVNDELGVDAYGTDAKVAESRFEHDVRRLRGLTIQINPQKGHVWVLESYGEFSPVGLSHEELNALAFLSETFSLGTPQAEPVQRLLRHIADWLPETQRDSIQARRQRLRIDLRRRDEDQVHPLVRKKIDQALSERRRLRFQYRTPSQVDGLPRTHIVEPWFEVYDTVRKHLYLDAYRLEVTGPNGRWLEAQWQRYRLGRILPDEITLLPEKLPPTPPKRPRYKLEYLLSPEITRLGEVTRHFEETTIQETNDEGWVRVTATTDDLFRALRLLLGYGPNCEVIGGSEAKREMVALVKAMAGLYTE